VFPRFSTSSDSLVPPEELRYVGGGDFKAVGKEFLDHFKGIGGLKPMDDVLDMGCGVGRIAVPLAGYLEESSTYAGFDIEPNAIEWCRENIAPLHSKFSFAHADLYNKRYNPDGEMQPSEYSFPYPDNSFDFALATSLFTHLLPDDLKHYLAEAARVLRPGGTLFATFYLINDAILARRSSWKPALTFEHVLDGHRVNSLRVPEAVVAYARASCSGLAKKQGSMSRVRFTMASGRGAPMA
jgi:SAM-dependent methyltransferase